MIQIPSQPSFDRILTGSAYDQTQHLSSDEPTQGSIPGYEDAVIMGFYSDPASGRSMLEQDPALLGLLFEHQPLLAEYLLNGDQQWTEDVALNPSAEQSGLSQAFRDAFLTDPAGTYFLQNHETLSRSFLEELGNDSLSIAFKSSTSFAIELAKDYPDAALSLSTYNPEDFSRLMATEPDFAIAFLKAHPEEAMASLTQNEYANLDSLLAIDPGVSLRIHRENPEGSRNLIDTHSTYATELIARSPGLLGTLYRENPERVEALFNGSNEGARAVIKGAPWVAQDLYANGDNAERFHALIAESDAFFTELWTHNPELGQTTYLNDAATMEKVHARFEWDDAFANRLFETEPFVRPIEGPDGGTIHTMQAQLFTVNPSRVEDLFLNNTDFTKRIFEHAPFLARELYTPDEPTEVPDLPDGEAPPEAPPNPFWERTQSLFQRDTNFALSLIKGDADVALEVFAGNPDVLLNLLNPQVPEDGEAFPLTIHNFAARIYTENRDLASGLLAGERGLSAAQGPFMDALMDQDPDAAYRLYIRGATEESVQPAIEERFKSDPEFATQVAEKAKKLFQALYENEKEPPNGIAAHVETLLKDDTQNAFATALLKTDPELIVNFYNNSSAPENKARIEALFNEDADFAVAMMGIQGDDERPFMQENFLNNEAFAERIEALMAENDAFPEAYFFAFDEPPLDIFEQNDLFALRLLETTPGIAGPMYSNEDPGWKMRLESLFLEDSPEALAAFESIFESNPSISSQLYEALPERTQSLYSGQPSFALAALKGDLETFLKLHANDSNQPKQLNALLAGEQGTDTQVALYKQQVEVKNALENPSNIAQFGELTQAQTDLKTLLEDLGGLTDIEAQYLQDDAFAAYVFTEDPDFALAMAEAHPERFQSLFEQDADFVKAVFSGTPEFGVEQYRNGIGTEHVDYLFQTDEAAVINIIANTEDFGLEMMEKFPDRTQQLFEDSTAFNQVLSSAQPEKYAEMDLTTTSAFKERILEGIRMQIFRDVQKMFQDAEEFMKEMLNE